VAIMVDFSQCKYYFHPLLKSWCLLHRNHCLNVLRYWISPLRLSMPCIILAWWMSDSDNWWASIGHIPAERKHTCWDQYLMT
jgi:cytosine/uracil/thiamine/allantoin permease